MEQTPPQQPTRPAAGQNPNMAMGVLAYIIFFIPLLTDAKKDPFVKFHVKQGLVIFIISVILWIIRAILPWEVLWSLSWLFSLLSLGLLALVIIGIVNVTQNKQTPLPLVGQFGEKFKF